METIKPQQNQNVFDIALQEYGSIEMVFELLEDNNIEEVTSEISVYEDLKTFREPVQKDVTQFYKSGNIHPATGTTLEELEMLKK